MKTALLLNYTVISALWWMCVKTYIISEFISSHPIFLFAATTWCKLMVTNLVSYFLDHCWSSTFNSQRKVGSSLRGKNDIHSWLTLTRWDTWFPCLFSYYFYKIKFFDTLLKKKKPNQTNYFLKYAMLKAYIM